jgi:hypothetical protein
MELGPSSVGSKVLLDGDDISTLLRGVRVRAGVGELTEVELLPAHGKRVNLVARLPEARVVILDDGKEPA